MTNPTNIQRDLVRVAKTPAWEYLTVGEVYRADNTPDVPGPPHGCPGRLRRGYPANHHQAGESTMTHNEYNGWTNYETWAVKLWIDNDEPTYRKWQRLTDATWTQTVAGANAHATRSEHARIRLADTLKAAHENDAPELAGPYSDLLSAALSEVDWFEIADALLTDGELDGYEPK